MIIKILQKYNAYRDTYFSNNKSLTLKSAELQEKLFTKYEKSIGKNWYGFSLEGCPDVWFYVIEEFLDYLLTLDPQLEIQQIKLNH